MKTPYKTQLIKEDKRRPKRSDNGPATGKAISRPSPIAAITVTTPDTLTGKTAYKLTITQDTGTVVTVKRGNQTLVNNADIYTGDQLTITVTGGTVAVNDSAFISGDIHIVSGNTAVVSTAG